MRTSSHIPTYKGVCGSQTSLSDKLVVDTVICTCNII